MNKIKVGLFIGIGPRAGGMFQYAFSVLDALKDLESSNLETMILYTHSELEPVLQASGLKYKNVKYAQFSLFLANVFMLLRLNGVVGRLLSKLLNPAVQQIKELKCDLWIFPSQDAIAFQLRTKIISVIHDLMHRYEPHFPEVSRFGRRRLRDFRYQELIKASTAVMVDSQIGKNQVVESYHCDEAKIHPLPYVPSKYIFSVPSKSDFDSKYSLPEAYLFYPAQFWPHKNHQRLFQAFESLSSRYSDLNLVLTGGFAHEYKKLKNWAEEKKLTHKILFMGYVQDKYLPMFYSRARAMIMPTFFGPTNIPPLEAFVCGCPVLASDIYGMREQLGDAALYFDPKNVTDMSQAIEKVWINQELRQILIKEGYKKIATWNKEAFSKKLFHVIQWTMQQT